MTQIMNTGLLLALFAIPVIGDECSAGSLAGLQNETCDIRNSEDQLRAGGGSGFELRQCWSAAGATALVLNAADFEFSPLSTNPVAFGTAETGYTITSSAGPISLTEPRRRTDFQAIVALDFSIVPQGGGIDAAGLLGTNIRVSGQAPVSPSWKRSSPERARICTL